MTIFDVFRKKIPLTPTGKVWKVAEHNDWGDRITIFMKHEHTYRWSGHTTPLVQVGDVLETELESGRVGRFLLTEVEHCGDPWDMWFATSSRWPIEVVDK